MNGAMHRFPRRFGIIFVLLAISGACGYLLLQHFTSAPDESQSDSVIHGGRKIADTSGSPDSYHSDKVSGESSDIIGEDSAGVDSSSSWEHPAWPGSLVLETLESAPGRAGVFRRVTVVRPPDLSYPVRIEEKMSRDPVTQREKILRRLEMVADRVLVKLHSGHTREELVSAVSGFGGRLVTQVGDQELFLVQLPDAGGGSVPEALDALMADGLLVEYAEPDYVYHAFATIPDDSLFNRQWNHNNTGQDGGLADADIDAPEGWDILNDASGVIVAINDTGVLYTHEDLAANMWVNPGEIPEDGIDNDGNGIIDDIHGFNAIDNTGNPLDDNGHGTHVAGIIGAVGNNGIGVAGVAWNVQLMALKFLSASGSGTLSDIIRCIDYARVNGADIMNNSWGGGGFSNSLRDAIVRARDAGIIFVASAGNEANNNDANPSYPASYDLGNILSVASSTRQNTLSSFTNFGSSTVDLAAPGSDIVSTYNDSDNSYRALSGTSMAAPQISGILALLKAHFPGVNYLGLIDRILAGADSITEMQGTSVTGGHANLQRSLSLDEVQEFPRIVQGLFDRSAVLGDSVDFSVIATGGEPLAYTWTKDGEVLPGENSATLGLTEISTEQAGIYEVTVSNSAGSTSNKASLFVGVPSTALGEALDDPSINWITLGNAEWTAQTFVTSDGVDAGVSGAIGNLQKSRLQTTVSGPGVISFYWKVSSERFFDFLVFYIDGNLQNLIAGDTPWDPQTYEVEAGVHLLEWVYDKDLFLALGNDAGYLDRFLFEADTFTPPTITQNPESVIILAGADVTFSVEAEGSQPLSYQWEKSGTPISGATQSTLVLSNVGVSDEGDYTVTVSNVAGTATSAAARLTVSAIDPPVINIQPQDLIAITGSTATLTVVVEGTPPLLYSWFKDSQILEDTNASSLVFDNVDSQDEGDYLVWIRNSAGSVISATANLSVVEALIAPIITRQPQNLDVVRGISATFTVVAGGNPPLSYQWFKDGAAIPGQINSSLTLTSVQPGDAGIYTVTIANPFGSTASAPAFLTVEASSSSISEALDNFEQVWSTTGNALWFFQNAVSRDGEDALQSGVITDLQSSAIHTTITGPGQISFYWKVSSERNLDLLNFYINDVLVDSISGILDWKLAAFEVIEGTHDIRWEYQKNISQSAGQDAGWVDLVEYVPFDTEKPRFTIHPQDRIGIEGGAASFTVEVVGENPISMQWQKDGIDLPGATSAVLELGGIVPEDAGEYRVVASNGFGSTTSRAGVLSVFQGLFTYSDALDNESFIWDVAGDAPWFGQSEVTIDGSDALQSGSVGNLQISTFSTTVKGPLVLSYWWRVSSEDNFDFLQLRMDSILLGEISGERAWRQIILTVPEGDHELEWSYVKDSGLSAGQDAGWIDRVKIISDNGAPLIFNQPESLTIAEGDNALLTVEAIGSGLLTYDWFRGQSGDTSDFQQSPFNGIFSTAALSASASYWVRVSNSFGFVDSHTVTVTVDPQIPRSSDTVVVGGSGSVMGLNLVHPIGNVYDQILMAGQSVAVQADPGQITRIVFLDENDDIVMAEFAGPGTLTITLDPATFEPPAPPVNYDQPNVNYVKGRASFQIFGATRDTWFAVFSLGELNIPFQNSSIFPESIIKNNVNYDGIADVSFLEFLETTEMGGILAGNALFTAEDQFVGIVAFEVKVIHMVAIGDIDAKGEAIPIIIFDPESEFSQLVITGGDMRQSNDFPVFLSVNGSAPGFQSIKTQDGIRSSGTLVPEKLIEARFQNGLQEIEIPVDQ